ncbi:hypothetical protein [Chryseobacterium aquaticum]|uniref:hypothetical protein n=1 Tax=Chryseobacterium aquaticum TaxID=452084 RepID=UPI002FC65B9E
MKFKKKFLLYVLIINFSCSTFKNNQNHENLYKVYKIEHTNNFYFIYCEKADRKYKIISQKNDKLNTKKIVIGNSYQFQLQDFPDYSQETNPLAGFTPLVTCFSLDKNTEVCEEYGISLCTTKNLKGLYYIK